jgi:aryl-alcohol dehydrogenase-like predicted oxidoreductase
MIGGTARRARTTSLRCQNRGEYSRVGLTEIERRQENRKANQALVDLLSKFAQQKKATPAQLPLAWLLAKKPWIVPIPGTTKLHRLEENLGAANLELTPEDLRAIESASSNIKVEGARYPQWLVPMSGR